MSRDLGKAIGDAIIPSMLEAVTERIAPMVDAALDRALAARPADVREVHVHMPEREPVNVGRQHATFPALVRAVSAGVPVWLVGPAGSGKTVAAERAALALGLEFSPVPVGPQTTQAHLFGYMDATGTYRATEVRKRYEHGGVLLLDEMDRGNAGVLTSLNALLANAVCSFPDGVIQRHADFRVVAAANTIGQGADRQYVGAVQLDAATLDRFATIEWSYDEAFERELAVQHGGADGAHWCDVVRRTRAACAELKLRVTVSPRATLHGIALLQAGATSADVAEMVLWRGMDTTTRERIMAHAGGTLVRDIKAAQPDADAPAASDGPTCPKCGKVVSVIKSRFDDTPTMLCWKKRTGCGHKWQVAA